MTQNTETNPQDCDLLASLRFADDYERALRLLKAAPLETKEGE